MYDFTRLDCIGNLRTIIYDIYFVYIYIYIRTSFQDNKKYVGLLKLLFVINIEIELQKLRLRFIRNTMMENEITLCPTAPFLSRFV